VLDVRVLGGLSAAVDGRPVELPADARARELLAWLALSPGPHGRSALAGRLRPDVAEEHARKTLRDAVYELRRALGPGARELLVATRDHVGLAGVDVRVDVREFRRLRAAGDLEGAAARGHGELLAGLDADWVLQARDEHAAALAEVLGELAARAEAAGDLAAAASRLRRRTELEPLAEEPHRELVRVLARAGDRAAALTAAGAFAERLRRELGIPPSPATRALVDEVRRGGHTASAGAPSGAERPPLPAPLARGAAPEGRERALASLEAAWADAASGALRVALVTGEPGIGKTTLAGALARRLHARGAAVLYGRCDEQALLPYGPWVEALEHLLEHLPAGEAARWLAAQDGALARLLPMRGAANGLPDGPRERHLAFETVRGLLEAVAAVWPVALVLDDLHWADEDSLSLLRHLGRTALRARMLLVLGARDTELTPAGAGAVAELRREGPVTGVALTGLDEEAVAAVVARLAGRADPDAVRGYRRRTGGNPLFLGELLRDEGERGGAAPEPSPGVRDVVGRRLARLGPQAVDVLALAAVRGLEFDLATVAEAGGRDPADVLEALDGALETGLVQAAGAPGRLAFAHALVAETLVAALPASRRARLHLQLAEHLAGRHAAGRGATAGEVAGHLRAAAPLAPPATLAEWELAAAREARAALAHAEAAAHFEAALAASPADARAELLLELGDARDRAGHRQPAREAFAQAAELARARRDPLLLAHAGLGFGGLAVVIAAPDAEVTGLLEEALAALPAGERATAARLRARLAVELYYADQDRARELSSRALADARMADDPVALTAALNARRVALWAPADVEERLEAVDEMVAVAEAAGLADAALQGRNWRVSDLWELGRMGEVRAEIDRYEARAEAAGLPHHRWWVPLWRAGLAVMAGSWAEAAAGAEQARALGTQAGDPNAPLLVRIHREFMAEVRHLPLDDAWYVEMARTSPVPGPYLSSLAIVLAASGRPDRARGIVAELVADDCALLPLNANWLGLCELADAIGELGEADAAAVVHAKLEPHARRFAVLARGVGCYHATDFYLGRCAAAMGRLDEAEARLRRALAAAAETGAHARIPAILLRLGEVLRARGEGARAADVLADAASRASALDIPALAERASRARATPAS
jgi:DNA-binding SARP family transcriptional activator/tetratricopeptide (TPR) repeat protein